MTRVCIDTSVFIAACVKSHPQHAASVQTVSRLDSGVGDACASTHAVAESWAVLTRLPVVPRVLPKLAWELIERNIIRRVQVIELATTDYVEALGLCAAHGWHGGLVYDVLHVMAARRANCNVLLTYNIAHFRRIAMNLEVRADLPDSTEGGATPPST